MEVCLASAYADGDGDGVADFEVEAYVSRKDLTNRKDGPTSKRCAPRALRPAAPIAAAVPAVRCLSTQERCA